MKARAASLLSLPLLAAWLAYGCAPDVVIAEGPRAAGGDDSTSLGGEAGESEVAGGDSFGGTPSSAGADGVEAGAPQGGMPFTPAPEYHVLADSVADFSLVQGERGWSYGYDKGSIDTFDLLPRKSVITAYVPPTGDVWDCWVTEPTHWTQIFQLGGHPNGTDTSAPSEPVEERAVRRWTSNYAGDVRLTGEIAKVDVTVGGSNGIDALILVDAIEVYSTFIGGEDGGGWSYEVYATVDIGSTIDFVIDAHEGSDHHDLTRFTAVIERYDAPVSE